jgi:arylsulfatase A-like enzyme
LDYDLKLNAASGFGQGNYTRFTPEQQKMWDAYYGKIEQEFEEMNLQGRELVKWKFQRYMRDYMSTAKSLDRNIGQILDYLDQKNLAENTIVIYTSDQGFYMGEHGWFDKRFMYEESLRMPFVMRYPKMIKPGTEVEELVVNIDFAPTLLEAAGVKVPDAIQGQSLLPLLKGEKSNWRDGVYYHYYEYPGEHMVMTHFGIRTPQYKLIRFYGDGDFWELYDLQNDPQEMNNVYGKSRYKKITQNLKEELTQLVKKYDDQTALGILVANQRKLGLPHSR